MHDDQKWYIQKSLTITWYSNVYSNKDTIHLKKTMVQYANKKLCILDIHTSPDTNPSVSYISIIRWIILWHIIAFVIQKLSHDMIVFKVLFCKTLHFFCHCTFCVCMCNLLVIIFTKTWDLGNPLFFIQNSIAPHLTNLSFEVNMKIDIISCN